MLEDVFLANGDDIELLTELKHRLCRMLDISNSGRDVAALSRQLMAVNSKLKELKGEIICVDLTDIVNRHRGNVVRKNREPLWISEEDDTEELE